MSLKIIQMVLGPLENNCYLVGDTQTNEAIVIDPSFSSEQVIQRALTENWTLTAIWITHAHFDHYVGAAKIITEAKVPIPLYLHADDLELWKQGGEAPKMGIEIDQSIQPTHLLGHHQQVQVGNFKFEVRHTPGHTKGHVTFYCKEIETAFCGDLIFYRSIGRTDLAGGDYQTLIYSIQSQIFTLPLNTQLLSGHGPKTKVYQEINFNPFLKINDKNL